MIKIGFISHLYPTKLNPYQGKFIQDLFIRINDIENIQADLIMPTPRSIPCTSRQKINNSEILENDNLSSKVSYISFPKQLFPKIIKLSLSNSLLRFFKNKDYDIIHINWLYPDGLALSKLKKKGYKVILHTHGSDWESNKNKPKMASFFKENFELADRIITVGPDLSESIESKFPFTKDKIETIYNSVDSLIYKVPSKSTKVSSKKNLNWDINKKHALTVANIRSEKGVDTLIKTIKDNKKLKNIQFHIIGKKESNSFSDEIRSLIDDSEFRNIIIHDPVPPKQLLQYYYAADFYISPSRREGFGLALVEACFTGLPFIATPVGIAPRLSEIGCGILLGREEFHKIDQYLDLLPPHFSEKVQIALEESFGVNKLLDRWEQLFESL